MASEYEDDWADDVASSLGGSPGETVVAEHLRVAHEAGVRKGAAEVSGLRPIVYWFAKQMERKLKANDFKGGWENDTPEALLVRVREEVEELAEVVGSKGPGSVGEAADVANMAMMVADVLTTERAARLMEEE